jgi:hypothetical protein
VSAARVFCGDFALTRRVAVRQILSVPIRSTVRVVWIARARHSHAMRAVAFFSFHGEKDPTEARKFLDRLMSLRGAMPPGRFMLVGEGGSGRCVVRCVQCPTLALVECAQID